MPPADVADEPAGLQVDERSEGGVDFAFGGGAGFQNTEVHPLRLRDFLHASDYSLKIRTVRFTENIEFYLKLGYRVNREEDVGCGTIKVDMSRRWGLARSLRRTAPKDGPLQF
jgi:hypothetical protein